MRALIFSCRSIQWQVSLSPNMCTVAAAQAGLITVYTYPHGQHDREERQLELPARFKKVPQSRLLVWDAESRYLLLFAGAGDDIGSKEGDILVLDTLKGEILGTLCSSSLLDSSSPLREKPSKLTGHSRCVNIFCIDSDIRSEADDCRGDAHLFSMCVVSALGRVVALSCSLRPCDTVISSCAEGLLEPKLLEPRHRNTFDNFELTCTILATIDGISPNFEGENKNGHAEVEVDDALWMPRYKSVILAVSSSAKSHTTVPSQLHIWNVVLTRKDKKNEWMWKNGQEAVLINNIYNRNIGGNSLGAKYDDSNDNSAVSIEPVRGVSLAVNTLDTVALLLLSTGSVVALTLNVTRETDRFMINVSCPSLVDIADVTRNWCADVNDAINYGVLESSSSKTITSLHFLTEDKVMVITRDGTVATWQLCCSDTGNWCLRDCDVEALPPCLGRGTSHCRTAVAQANATVANVDEGVLSRIVVLRAVDSWSCQVGVALVTLYCNVSHIFRVAMLAIFFS